MRALCKKSKILDHRNSCYICIHNGQIYEVINSSYAHGKGSYLIKMNNKRNYSMAGSRYLEYFYSPEEITNILRTKLIDEMTK